MFVVGLTGIFAVAAAAPMALRAVRRRTVAAGLAAAICLGSALIQLGASPATPAETEVAAGADTGAVATLLTLCKRVCGVVAMPGSFGDTVVEWAGVLFAAAVSAVFAEAAGRSGRWMLFAGWGAFGGALLAAVVIRFGNDMRPLMGLTDGERYFLVPQMLVVWGLVQAGFLTTRGWRWTAVALLVCVFATSALRFRLPAMPDNDWPEWAARIEAGESVGWVPITPEGMRFYFDETPRN